MFGKVPLKIIWSWLLDFIAIPQALEVAGASLLVVLISLVQIQAAQSPRSKPAQPLVLSDSQTARDNQSQPNPPAPNPPPPPSATVAAPWQGPVVPVSTSAAGGLAPVFYKLPITEPVVFLGIDDGWYQSPENLQWLKTHHLPFTLFLVDSQIKNNYDYFNQLRDAGMDIEDHSVTHPDFSKLNQPDQQSQICGAADSYQAVYGRRPVFFRPPYGDYNVITQQAAAACGIRAIVMWNVVLQDGSFQFQPPETRLEPGDIILAHFQNDLIPNMQALNAELEHDHLQVGRLEDWLR